jgi:pyruvate/2-oxoglutarate dehydrogenase complex dihydrolipoamide dehydrogenase (E3) component
MYDIIVIGAGSGGLNIAVFMNRVGFKTLLIDKTDRSIGGDCLNWGCVPSKALIHVSKLAYGAVEAQKFGLKSTGRIDLKKVMKYIDDKKEHIRKHENAAHFRKQGIDVVLGHAKFSGPNAVTVKGKEYRGKKIVIATGSRPRKLTIPGNESVVCLTNEQIFHLEKLPKKMVIIGGGPIGIEMAQAINRLGSQVTVIERGDTFLPKESPEIANVLRTQLEKEGVKFMFNTTTKRFTSPKEIVVEQDGKEKKIRFDEMLVSIGRMLNVEQLDLEKAGVEVENGRIKVDEYLRTTNKKVYVCGDVAGSYQFTHAAELHARVLLNNFFSPFKKKLNNDHLSWVTYTDPEIATFGLNEKQLTERGIEYTKLEQDYADVDRGITDDASGKMVLYLRKGKLLGGSLAAPGAGEIFQELVLANTSNLDVKHLFNKIYAYPTASRVNKKILSQYFSGKLTPFVKKLMHWLY